jgi:outer membrane protein assembly factor BamB
VVEDWPRFRGPNGSGTSTDATIPVQFSTTDNVLWKVELPGAGNSSPIIVGNRLFLQTASSDGKERSLLCLDASTGKTLWSKPAPGHAAATHKKNTLASSTPASDGERVFVIFWNGDEQSLAAFALDGKSLWQQELGAFKSQHGAGVSPIVANGKVIVPNDQDGKSVLLTFDAVTGKPGWSAPRAPCPACSYSAPFVMDDKLVVASSTGVTAYELATGKAKWNWQWKWPNEDKMLRMVGSPVLAEGVILLQTGNGAGNSNAVAVKADGSGVAWEKNRDFPYVPTFLVHEQHLYVATDKGFAMCVNAKTGNIVWRERLGGGFTASPVLIAGKVYAPSEEGTVFVFEASTKFKQLAKNNLGETIYASPAVNDGKLYIRGQKHLFCIGKTKA